MGLLELFDSARRLTTKWSTALSLLAIATTASSAMSFAFFVACVVRAFYDDDRPPEGERGVHGVLSRAHTAHAKAK